MKKILKSILTLAAVAFLSGPALAAAPAVGTLAPDFTLTDTNGKQVKLSDFKGKNVILEWTNHGCPFVVKHYNTGNMQKLQEEAVAAGDVWLSIVSSAPGTQGHTTPEEANAIIAEKGAKATARLLDPTGETGKLYDARTTPHMFVVNADGILVYAGAIDDNPSPRHETVATAKNYVKAALADLAAGRPVETSTSQPYGCGVKYGTN